MCVRARAATDVSRSVFVSPRIHTTFSRTVLLSFPALGACTPSRPLLSFSSALALALGRGPESHSQPYGPKFQWTKVFKATAIKKVGDQETGDRRKEKSRQEGHQPQEEEEGSHRET